MGIRDLSTAEIFLRGWLVHYNFVRPHQGLEGKTPAEMANLDLGLGENRVKGLIEKAVEHRVKTVLIKVLKA